MPVLVLAAGSPFDTAGAAGDSPRVLSCFARFVPLFWYPEAYPRRPKGRAIPFRRLVVSTKKQHPARSDPESGLLHAELLSIDQLKRHAVALAGSHSVDRRPGRDQLLPRLAENERVLAEAYAVVTAAVAAKQRVIPAEAWLLDNYYLIEQQIALARRHLPPGYSRQLPRLTDGPPRASRASTTWPST